MRGIREGMLGLLALAVVGVLFWWSRQMTPEKAAEQLFNLDAPSRYVFVSDADKAQVVSVDSERNAVAAVLPLRVVPRLMAMHRSEGMLAYAADDSPAVFVRWLASQAEREFALTHDASGLLFAGAGGQLLVYGEDALTVLDMATGDGRTHTGFARIRSVHAVSLADDWVVLDEGAVSRLRADGALGVRTALPQGWRPVSAAALSADGEVLLFGVQDAAQGAYLAVVWQVESGSWQAFPVSAPVLQPVIDNAGQRLFFADTHGVGWRVDRVSGEAVRFAVPDKARRMALGWLDQHVLVAGEGVLQLLDATTLERVGSTSFAGAVRDVFVTADSKTALLVAEGAQLFFYDLRDGGLRVLALPDGVRPLRALMGASYTLCH